MRIALYQPDIPQNTGTVLRLSACLGVPVDVIEPTGFDMSDRALRRAGLDYLDQAALTRHRSWNHFLSDLRANEPPPRLVLLSSQAQLSHHAFAFRPDDVLLFGRESAGAPPDVHDAANVHLRVPMQPAMRSLNLAVSVAIVVDAAGTQTQLWPDIAPPKHRPAK